MKTIKIIDLLNKIANGEDIPKKIKYNGKIYEKFDYNNKYYDVENNTRETDILSEHLASESFYNDEVEILEENKKIPEKLKLSDYNEVQSQFELDVIARINKLIDYLKSKGDE